MALQTSPGKLPVMFRVAAVPIVLASLAVVTANATDWFQWRGPDRSGVIPQEIVKNSSPSFGKVWDDEVGIGCSSMVISDGRLFTVGHDPDARVDQVFAFDAKSGQRIWKHTYPAALLARNYEGGPAATPTVDGDTVYVYSREGRLLALNASDGRVKWQVDVTSELGGKAPRWMYSTSPLVYENKVIVDVGGPNASTVAFDKANGKVIWKSGNDPAGYSSPVLMTVGGKPRVAMFNGFGLVVVNPGTGAQTARYEWETSYGVNAATPLVIGDGMLLISSGYGKGSALLQISDGGVKEMWRTEELQSQFLSPVYYQGIIFGFDSGDKRLKAINSRTGDVFWESRDYGRGGSVTIAGSTIVVLNELGDLYLTKATRSGLTNLAEVKAVRPKTWVAPAIEGDLIYVRNNRGDLVCWRVQ